MRYSRQNKIIELISSRDIGTQEELASLLRESGFEVTQATVSRDIKELQLVKVLSADGNTNILPPSLRISLLPTGSQKFSAKL